MFVQITVEVEDIFMTDVVYHKYQCVEDVVKDCEDGKFDGFSVRHIGIDVKEGDSNEILEGLAPLFDLVGPRLYYFVFKHVDNIILDRNIFTDRVMIGYFSIMSPSLYVTDSFVKNITVGIHANFNSVVKTIPKVKYTRKCRVSVPDECMYLLEDSPAFKHSSGLFTLENLDREFNKYVQNQLSDIRNKAKSARN